MNDESRRWLAIATAVTGGRTTGLTCPASGDRDSRVTWHSAANGDGDGDGGEWHLWCPVCHAENYLLARDRRSTDASSKDPQ